MAAILARFIPQGAPALEKRHTHRQSGALLLKARADCHRSRKAFYVARPRAYVTHVKPHALQCKAGHKRSFSAHSTAVSVPGALFVPRHRSRIENAPLRPRRRSAPRSAPSLAPSISIRFVQGFHKRQAALALHSRSRCLRSLRLRFRRVLGRTSAWLKTPSRLLPRLVLLHLAPRGSPQPCHGSRCSPASACPRHHLGLSASPCGALLHPAR